MISLLLLLGSVLCFVDLVECYGNNSNIRGSSGRSRSSSSGTTTVAQQPIDDNTNHDHDHRGLDTIITHDDCPISMPVIRGQSCIVPSGFQYQYCYYPASPSSKDTGDGTVAATMTTRCSCRADEGRFMCVTIPSASLSTLPPSLPPTSRQQPITIPATSAPPPTLLPPTYLPTRLPTMGPTLTLTTTNNTDSDTDTNTDTDTDNVPSTVPSPVPVVVVAPPTPTPIAMMSDSPSQPSAMSSFNQNLASHCYVAGTATSTGTDGRSTTGTLPQTGDSCYVPDTLEYSNCVFAISAKTQQYLYTVKRCVCNPRELIDENYRDKFICNILLNEPL